MQGTLKWACYSLLRCSRNFQHKCENRSLPCFNIVAIMVDHVVIYYIFVRWFSIIFFGI